MITKGKNVLNVLNSLNVFCKEMCEDRSGEFVRGYWG